MPITNYLPSSRLIQPGVCTSTTRPASPFEGQVIYETNTKQTLVYNGSAWVMLTDADTPPGLELVKTQTIGSAVSSVTVTGAFSSTYDNYRIIINGVSLSGTGNSWFLKVSNATSTSTKYVGDYMDFSSSTKFTLNSTSSPSGVWMGVTGGTSGACIDIYDPFNTKIKLFFGQSSGTTYGNEFRGVDTNAVSSTDFVLTQSTTTMTGGTIRVYGYRNS